MLPNIEFWGREFGTACQWYRQESKAGKEMRFCLAICLYCLIAVLGLLPTSAVAIEVVIDYQYDTNNFFGAGNPDGPAAGVQAKASLEAVADYYSGILTDSFSSVQTPDTFNSMPFDGQVTWNWSMLFNNPQTNASLSLSNQTIASDEYRIFAGARSLSGSTLGIGGPGGYSWSNSPSGGFTQGELDEIDQITAEFSDAVENRGEASGFAKWGGSVAFDNDAGANWYFDHTTAPSAGLNDFYSIAVHEIGHSLGLGVASEWDALVSGGDFFGSASVSEYGGSVPLDCDINGCGHWAEGTLSEVLGTTISQEVALTSTVLQGTRKQLTKLDAAGLTDLGWSVVSPTFDTADYDMNGDVDGVDLAYWETWFGINSNADADGDGDTDGADFLIWQRQYNGSPAADYDMDGDVDGVDLAYWKTWFGINSNADADGDDDTDGADFLIWQRQHTGSLSALAATATVPEPGTVWLALISLIVFNRRPSRANSQD